MKRRIGYWSWNAKDLVQIGHYRCTNQAIYMGRQIMSAKKPQTPHAKALAAYNLNRITRAEYMKCVVGHAVIRGNEIWQRNGYTWRWNRRYLR